MALDRVGGDADDFRVGGREVSLQRLEILGFQGAAAGIVLGVEIQHDLPASQALEGEVSPVGRRQRECRGTGRR